MNERLLESLDSFCSTTFPPSSYRLLPVSLVVSVYHYFLSLSVSVCVSIRLLLASPSFAAYRLAAYLCLLPFTPFASLFLYVSLFLYFAVYVSLCLSLSVCLALSLFLKKLCLRFVWYKQRLRRL